MIKLVNISKYYGSFKAVDSVSFEINKGEVLGFLGPNGAGKSTIMKIISNIISPSSGEVLIGDDKVGVLSSRKVGYLPESNPLYQNMYVREYLSFIASVYNLPLSSVESAINQTQLNSHANSKIEELSKGYKQRVGLAAAIIHNPDYLILDEPTTGLDPIQVDEIRHLIREFGKTKTVLLSTHIMQEVEAMCDRVILINKGGLIADSKLKDFHSGSVNSCKVTFANDFPEESLSNIKGISKVEKINNMSFRLEYDSKSILGSLNDFAIENASEILSYSSSSESLEEKFKKLTQS